jgi:hypothetical protein
MVPGRDYGYVDLGVPVPLAVLASRKVSVLQLNIAFDENSGQETRICTDLESTTRCVGTGDQYELIEARKILTFVYWNVSWRPVKVASID